MSEKTLRRWFSKILRKNKAHVQNIEDAYSIGVPDTNLCINGRESWVECKFLKDWPKRATTPVRPSFRPGQVPWLVNRSQAGGSCYVLIQIGADVLLFEGKAAWNLDMGIWNQTRFRAEALAVGRKAVLREFGIGMTREEELAWLSMHM